MYAGVFSGTVDYDDLGSGVPVDAIFFCAELNHPLPVPSYDIPFTTTTIPLAEFHDGSNPGSDTGVALTAQQKCLLVGVYKALGITTAEGFTTNGGVQDLSGTSDSVQSLLLLKPALSNEEAAAAQLVMWEIIHDFAFFSPSNPASMLTNGKLTWFSGYDIDDNLVALDAAVVTEFNSITSSAYSFCAVPEVTSPVALIAGGLLFLRRREPRALRFKSPAP